MKKFKYLIFATVLLSVIGCSKDFLETEMKREISDEQIAASPASTQYIVNGLYASLRTFDIGGSGGFHTDYGHMSAKIASDMMGHDITMPFNHWYGAYHNYTGRLQTSGYDRHLFITYYGLIQSINIVVEAIPESTENEEVKAYLGQALALRALCYHQLVRFYADPVSVSPSAPGIPLYTGEETDGVGRGIVADAYELMLSDLNKAVDLLAGFNRESKEVIDQQIAYGFLARVHLDLENWAEARDAAMAARAGFALQEWDGFSNLPGNTEAMWGSDIDAESSTTYASFFSHFSNPAPGYTGALGVYKGISRSLYDQISLSDKRKDHFVDPVNGSAQYPNLPAYANLKFIDETFFEGDYIYMRASEMYLIEAEARAMLNDPAASEVLYDLISFRDPSYTESTATGNALREEIYLHRRIELWGEGVSFFDLKRLQKPVVRTYAGTNHATFALIDVPVGGKEFKMQFPLDEINSNDAISEKDQNAKMELLPKDNDLRDP